MTVDLFLSAQSAKYINFHIVSGKISFNRPIGAIILGALHREDPSQKRKAVFELPHRVEIELPKTHRASIQVNTNNNYYWIPPIAMRQVDESIKRLIKYEMLVALEYNKNREQKQVIVELMHKYDLEDNDISIDALIKFAWRNRGKQDVLMFGT
jgi:hypothetical protein